MLNDEDNVLFLINKYTRLKKDMDTLNIQPISLNNLLTLLKFMDMQIGMFNSSYYQEITSDEIIDLINDLKRVLNEIKRRNKK